MNDELPPEAPGPSGNVTRVTLGEREILLVGTAHVSKKSAEEARRLITEVRPDSVCVELDSARYETLRDETRWQRLEVLPILTERRAGLFLASLLFAGFQRRLGEGLGTRPGAEMLAAVEAAQSVGAEVVLADREVQTTLARCRASLSPLERLKVSLLLSLLPFAAPKMDEAQVEELKTREAMSDAMEAFAQQLPSLKTPLIDERDRFLAASISEAPGKRIVAVVGAAHAAGIARHIGEPVDRATISGRPAETARDRALSFVVPLVVAGTVLIAGLRVGFGTASSIISSWVALWSGAAVLLVGVLTRMHLLTMLCGAVLGPLSLVFPLAPLGPLLGRLQARITPPQPEDAARLREDVLEPRRLGQNRFLKIVIFAVLAPAARTLGALVGLGWALLALRR